jgi:methionine-rich copper-binding protein CopC
MKLLAAVAAFACLCAQTAWAHSQLTSAVPADGSTVASPVEIDLSFSEDINAKFSGIDILGADGAKVMAEPAQLKDGKTLVLPLAKPLAAGSYRVDWHVLSADGHKTKGSFAFTVKP